MSSLSLDSPTPGGPDSSLTATRPLWEVCSVTGSPRPVRVPPAYVPVRALMGTKPGVGEACCGFSDWDLSLLPTSPVLQGEATVLSVIPKVGSCLTGTSSRAKPPGPRALRAQWGR